MVTSIQTVTYISIDTYDRISVTYFQVHIALLVRFYTVIPIK